MFFPLHFLELSVFPSPVISRCERGHEISPHVVSNHDIKCVLFKSFSEGKKICKAVNKIPSFSESIYVSFSLFLVKTDGGWGDGSVGNAFAT